MRAQVKPAELARRAKKPSRMDTWARMSGEQGNGSVAVGGFDSSLLGGGQEGGEMGRLLFSGHDADLDLF